MKKILSIVIIMLVVLSGCGESTVSLNVKNQVYVENGYAKNDVNSTDFETVAENDYLIFRINPDTTDIELENKATGYIWKSYSESESGTVGKVLELTYLNSSGKTEIMNSMDDSVKKGQYKIDKKDNGATVTYSLGDIVADVIYPIYISAERFDKFVEKMSERQKAIVAPLYLHLAEGVYSDEMYNDFLSKFPNAKNKDVYVLREADILSNIKKQISMAFADAGYTEEDLIKDSKEFNIDSEIGTSKDIQFNVIVDYTLDEKNLKVFCPSKDLFWSSDSSPIESMSILPYFGTPNRTQNGYFLLPDGSGSLVGFYNGTEDSGKVIKVPVYGENLSITANEKIYDYEQAVLPVYGIKIDDNALLAVIQEGDAIADINVISGTDSLCARIWANFNLFDTQLVYAKSLSSSNANQVANSSYTMEQAQRYDGNITVNYRFLSGNKADYNGMAEYYSQYLFGNKNVDSNELPIYLDVISAIDYNKVISGFNREVISTVTTFDEAEKISDDLTSRGISNQKLLLSGWQKNGLRDGYVSEMKVSSKAGGQKGLKTLIDNLASKGIELFPDVDVQFVYHSAVSKINKKLVARNLVQQIAQNSIYDISTYQKVENEAYIMTPEYTYESIKSIPTVLKKYNVNAVSLRYIGRYNIPDYDDDDVIDRQETSDLIEKSLEQSSNKYSSVLTQVGNANVVGYMTDIVKLPLYSRRYNNTVEIPFTAMVYSGHIDYSGDSYNLSGSTKKDLLKLIESGAGLMYTVSWSRDDNIKSSQFDALYSICYNDLKENIHSSYNYVSKALNNVYGTKIIKHEILENNLVKVTYENGTYFIINYNEYPITIDGVKIEASEYVKGDNN